MSVQITIRNVPNEVRDEIAARAARSGKSMQEFLQQELKNLARRPSLDQWLSQVRRRKELAPQKVSSDVLLGHRDSDRK